mmetsp:Transcript_75897/g.164257  ORF Transcript_75897/g.164257 Transcript_75897/m.164257 type:complete len:491 (-) Transcript_75897:197-1669(-)
MAQSYSAEVSPCLHGERHSELDVRRLQYPLEGAAAEDAVDEGIELREAQRSRVDLEAVPLGSEGYEEVAGVGRVEVEGLKHTGAKLHVHPHHLDGVRAVLVGQLTRGFLHRGVGASLQPQEAELAVLRTAVAGLVPLLRPLLERGRGPGLPAHGDAFHQPEVDDVLLQLEVELLSDLADLVERIQPDDPRDPHVVLTLQRCLEDAGLVAARHHGKRGAPLELAAQGLPHWRRPRLVGEKDNRRALGVVEPGLELAFVLQNGGVVGHRLARPLAKSLGRDRALVDLGRLRLVLREPPQSGPLADGCRRACVPLLPAVDRRDLEEVLEGVCELLELLLCLHTTVIVWLVEVDQPRLVPVVDEGLVDVGGQLRDVGVVVDVLLGTRLALLHEHHLTPAVHDAHVPVRLTPEELPEHGLRLLVGLRALFEALLTVSVVDLPLLGVAEYLVRSRHLDELGLTLLLAKSALVGVELQRLRTVGLLDFRDIRLLGNP